MGVDEYNRARQELFKCGTDVAVTQHLYPMYAMYIRTCNFKSGMTAHCLPRTGSGHRQTGR
eukprot:2687132-Pleurochrysis_carterae.AAC.1